MKQVLERIAWLALQILVVVSFIGLALSATGIVFEYPTLYRMGLMLSAPLYILVLPFCILVLALMFVGLCYGVIESLFSFRRKRKIPKDVE
jgi:uncharacterized membrane protein